MIGSTKPPKMTKRLTLMRGPELIHNQLIHKQYGIVVSFFCTSVLLTFYSAQVFVYFLGTLRWEVTLRSHGNVTFDNQQKDGFEQNVCCMEG